MDLKWIVMDGIGPFFRACPDGVINWSKIPFTDFESRVSEDPTFWDGLLGDFRVICDASKSMGVNVLTLDDLAHLTIMKDDPLELRQKAMFYRERFRCLAMMANSDNIEIWITSDVMHWSDHLDEKIGKGFEDRLAWFTESCARCLDDNPWVKGIIFRFGESDGKDVMGDYRSLLAICPATIKTDISDN